MQVPTFNIPSESQNSLTNIVEQENSVTQLETVKTKDDFFADVQKMVNTGNFSGQNEAILETAKYANSKGVQYEGINYDELFESTTTPEVIEEEITQEEDNTILGGISNVGERLVSDAKSVVTGELLGKVGTAISDTSKKFKFQSNIDDGIIESGAKFLGNLPANTTQIAGDIMTIAADPLGTIDSVGTLATAGVETALNKIFLEEGEEVFTTDEIRLVSESVSKELAKLGDEGRIKELLTENPADVLLTFAGGAGVAKNVALSKNLTGLASKLDKVEKVLNPIKIQADALKSAKSGVGNIKTSLFPEKSLDELVLEISQGEKANIPSVKTTLGLIDTKKINTFEDFDKTIGDKITQIAKKQDELLPTDEILKIEDLSTIQGKRSTNFIQNALDDLEEVGNKSNDLDLLNRVDSLRDKDGISVKDINDLARFYGSEFKNKSFDKLGNQKSSITASTFENNRKGIKQVSRDLLPDDTVKALDEELSALFETKNLTTKTTKKVDDLFKKLNKRGLGSKIGGTIGKLINTLSLGTAGGLVQAFIGRNVGQKTMNNLAMQSNLAKNLKKFADLEKKADKLTDKALEQEVKNLLNDTVGENALKIEAGSTLENNN